MPYLVLFGKEWDFCSDMLTIYLFVPITVLGAWIIPLAVQVYEEREKDCFGKPGHGYYRVAILSLFLVFLIQLGTMLLAFAASLRGTPLQVSKRWLADCFIGAIYLFCVIHLGLTIYGTWVLSEYTGLPCPNDSALHTLVGSSWGALAAVVVWTLLCLKWFPNQAGTVDAWISRLHCVCTVCGCLGFKSAMDPLRQMDADEPDGDEANQGNRENALVSHLAETFHVIFGDLSFTQSDRHVALVLATALQQVRRRERIRACLLDGGPARGPDSTGEEKQQSRSLRRSITHKWPTIVTPSSYASKVKPELPADKAADLYTGLSDRVSLPDLEEALGYFDYAVAAYYVQDEGMVASEKSKTAEKATEANEEPATAEKQQRLKSEAAHPPQNDKLADATPPTYSQHPGPAPETTAPLNDPVGLIHAPLGDGTQPAHEQGPAGTTPPGQESSSGNDDLRPGAHTSVPVSQNSRLTEGDKCPSDSSQGDAAEADSTSAIRAHGEAAPTKEDSSSGNVDIRARERTSDVASEGKSAVDNTAVLREAAVPDSSPAVDRKRSGIVSGNAEEGLTGTSSAADGELDAGAAANPVVDAFRRAAAALAGAVRTADPQQATQTHQDDDSDLARDVEMGIPSTNGADGSHGNERSPVGEEADIGAHPAHTHVQQAGVEPLQATAKAQASPYSRQPATQQSQNKEQPATAENAEVHNPPAQPPDRQVRPEQPWQATGKSAVANAQHDKRPAHAGPEGTKPRARAPTPPRYGSPVRLSHEVGKSSRFPERQREELLGGREMHPHHHHAGAAEQKGGQQPNPSKKKAEGLPATNSCKAGDEADKAAVLEHKGTIEEGDGGKVESERCTLCTCTSRPPEPTPLDALDCIYSRADNTILGTLPYMIALDWERRAIVVGVRGTSSMSDALTDAIAQPIPILPWLGDVVTEPDGGVAAVHSGILAAAAAVNHDLEDHGILGALLSGAAVDAKARARHIRQQPTPAHASAVGIGSMSNNDDAEEGRDLVREMSTVEEEDAEEAQPAEDRRKSAQALMERDEEVMSQARAAKEAERRRHLESRRAASFRRRSPPRRRASLSRDAPGISLENDRRSASLGLPSKLSAGEELEMQRTASVPHSAARPVSFNADTKAARENPAGTGRRSFSIRFRKNDIEAQHPELESDHDGVLSATSVKSALRRIYSRAKNTLHHEDSPSSSPRVGEKGNRLEAMLQDVEDAYKKVFLSKIFSKEQDLRRLESAHRTEEQQRRRAEARARRLKQLEERQLDCRGWQLVLTGHSLGAGVAALLALKLRPRFPRVPIKCWAFCPPGGLVTPGLAHAMEPFCTSVIVGKDGVPRASLGNLSRLVDEVTVALARGRRCKTRVLLRNFTARGRAKLLKPGEFYDNDEIPQECREVLDGYLAGAAKRAETIGQAVFPPGRVMYCRRLKGARKDVSYDAVWAPPEDIINEGFIISSRMLKDHLCDAVSDALETAAQRLRKPSQEVSASMPGHDISDEESEGE